MQQHQIDILRSQTVAPQLLFIDGKWQPGTGSQLEITSPADGEVITTIERASRADMQAAIKAARKSFDDGRWANQAPGERKRVLLKLADLIQQNELELAVLGVRDNGTEIGMAIKAEPGSAAGTFRYYAEATDKVYGEIPTENTCKLTTTKDRLDDESIANRIDPNLLNPFKNEKISVVYGSRVLNTKRYRSNNFNHTFNVFAF